MLVSKADNSIDSSRAAHPVVEDAAARLCRMMLNELGEDPSREGLKKTPARFAKAMRELTKGYHQDIDTVVNGAIFDHPYTDMVFVRDIEFSSLCEHHVLPFFGRAHVAYLPAGKIVGLSKIPRIVELFSKRLQVQERLTNQIADALEELLQPRGVACMLEGSHMCMAMRGVQARGSTMVTKAMRGVFMQDATADQFLRLIGR